MLIEQPHGRCKWKSLFGHSLQFQANLRLCLESPFRFMSTSTGQPDIDHHALSDIATWGQCVMKTKQSPETKGGDVAQLVEHRPVTPLTPWCGKGFFSQSQLSVQTLSRVSIHLRVPWHTLISKCIVKRSCSPCQSSVEYGNTKTPSMHRTLVGATLSQLAFPGKATRISHWINSFGTVKL